MAMTRAKRIEEAARALLNTHPDDPETHAARAALRAALALPEEASEIASLRAEVARLTEERDDSYHSALAASRALADRLAEALVEARTRLDDEAEALCWCHMPPGFHDPACVAARAALREWEEARRGSEGGGR